MKSSIVTFIALFIFLLFDGASVNGQNTLTFSQGLIVGSSTVTVPAGKIWKVESIFGEQVNACIPVDCLASGWWAKGLASGMYVNGTMIPSTLRGFSTSQTMWNNNLCTTGANSSNNLSCAAKSADPNILPMWLPAGTTLASLGATTFVNVLEFNIE